LYPPINYRHHHQKWTTRFPGRGRYRSHANAAEGGCIVTFTFLKTNSFVFVILRIF